MYRVNASIKVAVTFAPQLDRLTIRCNHDVVESVTVRATEIILGLVATHLLNNHIVDVYTRIATRACAGDKVSDVERLILMIRRPHGRRSITQRNDGRAIVDCQDRCLDSTTARARSGYGYRVVSRASAPVGMVTFGLFPPTGLPSRVHA